MNAMSAVQSSRIRSISPTGRFVARIFIFENRVVIGRQGVVPSDESQLFESRADGFGLPAVAREEHDPHNVVRNAVVAFLVLVELGVGYNAEVRLHVAEPIRVVQKAKKKHTVVFTEVYQIIQSLLCAVFVPLEISTGCVVDKLIQTVADIGRALGVDRNYRKIILVACRGARSGSVEEAVEIAVIIDTISDSVAAIRLSVVVYVGIYLSRDLREPDRTSIFRL